MKNALFLSLVLGFLVSCGGSGSENTASAPNASPSPEEPPAQTVTIDSPDGVKLKGSLFVAKRENAPALLFLHQWESDRHSYDDFARKMQGAGFTVLAIDGRGFGESTQKADGTPVTAGRSEADVKAMLGDVAASFAFLTKQPGVDPAKVGIVGASYGSSLALIYAADEPKVSALMLLSPGLNYFGAMPTEPAAKKYGKNRPLLMLAAKDDAESADAVQKLLTHSQKSENWRSQVYESGGHGTALLKYGLKGAVGKFFDDVFNKAK